VPRVAELAVQHAKIGWILEIHSARSVLARIAELHMVKRVEELRVERGPDPFGDSRGLGNAEIQVPAMLPIQRAEIVGSAVEPQDYRPEVVVCRRGVGEKVDPGAADTWRRARIAVAADKG